MCRQHINVEVPASMGAGTEENIQCKVPKVDKNHWVKTMENIVLYLKLIRAVRGALLAHEIHTTSKYFIF